MSDRHAGGARPEDLPWNDALGDSDAPPGSEEPAPADVVGEGDRMRDLASPPHLDENEAPGPDQLSRRLGQEEPDRTAGPEADPEAELQAPEPGDEDVVAAEGDEGGPGGAPDDLPAEEAAVHVREEP